MSIPGYAYNPPPGWQVPSEDWTPPAGWTPDPSWPPAPAGWQFWVKKAAQAEPPSEPVPPAKVGQPRTDDPTSAVVVEERPSEEESIAGDAQPPSKISAPSENEERLKRRVADLEAEVARLVASGADDGTIELSDERVLQEVGIYRYHHPLENAAEYKEELGKISQQIKDMVKAREAVLVSDMFTFNNSLAQGRRMTAEFSKLMLRAYNAEADNCVRALRAGNVVTAKKRLESSVTTIAKLGAMMEMRINPEYHALRLRELELTADYLMKLQVEKEEAREERERLREERKAEQELAAERAKLDKEREHYVNALKSMAENGDAAAVEELEQRLRDIDEAIERNDFRAANIRAGYVYIISNPGALGSHVVKIGLTRRLEPMDRVRELGDASVPFPFDVHALFFAEDAVTVEAELHRAFAERRVNHVNQRREFFFATPAEVREVLMQKVGNLLEFVEHPEATEFLQSKKYWPEPGAAANAPTLLSVSE
jgi:Domain of unknown function (DUF4041)/T5orf172 domain